MKLSLTIALAITITACCLVVSGQDASQQRWAHDLASETGRQRAIGNIAGSKSDPMPILLSLARKPPADVDQHELYIGLAEAFGQLKAKKAIPFLVRNIGLSRTNRVNIWLKTAKVVEEDMPAVAALIRIGPDASRALIHAYWRPMEPDDRLAAIFVVSQIGNVPEARSFLTSVLGEANLERSRAEEGLRMLDKEASGK